MAEGSSPALRAIQPYILVSKQFSKRDPVVSYYATMFAVQEGIPASKSDPGAKAFLAQLMDQLEVMKRGLTGEEALTSDVVAQAHIEAVGLKLFEYADKEDRAANFHRNMIKAFFTSSHIFSVLKQFGELSEEIDAKMKYAKWKAVEIDRCLKNGITPTPGPPGGDELLEGLPVPGGELADTHQPPPAPPDAQQPWVEPYPPHPAQEVQPEKPTPKPRHQAVPPQPSPAQPVHPPTVATGMAGETVSGSGAQLSPGDISKAQKLCKYASSALDYDDTPGAIDYLTQALELLKSAKY